jgi:hypothetical protein
MTLRIRWGKMIRVAGVVVLAVVAGLAVFVQVQQHILRWRAERLLADMRELQSHKSTWADAQKIMTRWGAWGSYEGHCTAGQCNYYIHVQGSGSAFIQSLHEEIPLLKLLQCPFVLMGGGGDWVDATLRVKDGIVAESKYDIFLVVPFSPRNYSEFPAGYALVGIASQSADGFDPYSFRADRLLHPEYWIGVTGGCEGCIKFMTEFTPLAGREKIRELTDFNLSCITRLMPCTTEADLMPTAWKQYKEELPSKQARTVAFDQCRVPLEFFGREYGNIAVVDVISRQTTRPPDSAYLAVRLRVGHMLKGQTQWQLSKPEDAMAYDRGQAISGWSSTDMLIGKRYILIASIGKDEAGKNTGQSHLKLA